MRMFCALALLVSVSGCGMRYYAQPSASAPHARVVIRFDHGARTDVGPLDEFIWIDGDPIELRVDDDHALRVRTVPGPTRWVFKTMRYHEEESVMRHTSTYGSSGHTYQRTTYTPIVDHVGDAGCTARFDQTMHDGDVYLFTYRYVSPEECSVTCAHGARQADGTFAQEPCDGVVEAPPPSGSPRR